MDLIELMEIVELGETSKVQFKREFNDAKMLAMEIAAFANSRGGRIFVGVEDNREITGLSSEEIRQLNNHISNACKNNIEPDISVMVDTVKYSDEKFVMVIDVPMGLNKFYTANGNEIWVKVGANKRKAGREEIRRMLQESHNLTADETIVPKTGIEDLNRELLYKYVEKKSGIFADILIENRQFENILENLKLMNKGECTICGLVLFQKKPYIDKISSTVKMLAFTGNEFGGDNYTDREEVNGDIVTVYKGVMSFFNRQLKKEQVEENPNSRPEWEIPEDALKEAVVNALVHRNYFLQMNIRIIAYNNRIEILSPGLLPNTLTVESIKYGMSVHRNPNIISNIKDIPEIPYAGLGMGIKRIMDACNRKGIETDFINHEDTNQFKVIFWKK